MKKAPLFPVLAILSAVLILAVYYLSSRMPEPSDSDGNQARLDVPEMIEVPKVVFGNPTLGPRDAKLTVVEFGDYLCLPCSESDQTLRRLMREYPEDIRVVWKDMPNEGAHPGATKAAVAARCAGDQGAFWDYHDLLLSGLAGGTDESYADAAEQFGLDSDQFASCLSAEQALPLVRRDLEEAVALRLDATPYLFINERPLAGSTPYSLLKNIIDNELALIERGAVVDTGSDAELLNPPEQK